MKVGLIDIFIENMAEACEEKKFLEKFLVLDLPEKALSQLYLKENFYHRCAFKVPVIQSFLTHG